MQPIRKFKIDVMPKNIHPFHDENPYRVSQQISYDGGQNYQSQGLGNFFRSELEAREFINSVSARHPQDITTVDEIEYLTPPKATIQFVVFDSNAQDQRYKMSTNISFNGKDYQPLSSDLYFRSPQDVNNFINEFASNNPNDKIDIIRANQQQQAPTQQQSIQNNYQYIQKM